MRKTITKSIVSLSLIIVLFIVTFSVAYSWIIHLYNIENPTIGKINSHFAGGDGLTPGTAYKITMPEHFYNLAYLQNSGYFNKENVTFYFEIPLPITEIDFTNSYFQTIPPIGTYTYPFVSIFNGNNSVLKSYIVDGVAMQDIGTFGCLGSNALISNLILDSPTIISEPAIDIDTTNFHPHKDLEKNISTGYIAGHVTSGASLSNVFVVSPNIISKLNAFSNRSQYGLIGFSEENNGIIPGGPREKYSFTLNAPEAADKIYRAVTHPDLADYYVYDDEIPGITSIPLSTAITATSSTAVTINNPYTLSTLKIASATNPVPVYFYDMLASLPSVGPIGTGDQIYVKENIDLVGTSTFSSGNLDVFILDFSVPSINDQNGNPNLFNPSDYSSGVLLYVKPTNNLANLGTLNTITSNQSANLTFKTGWSGGIYQGGALSAGTVSFTSPLIMNASSAFTAVKVNESGQMTVVDTTIEMPDYYVFLMGVDSNGKLKVNSINFNYNPAVDQTSLSDITGVDFIDPSEITTLQQGTPHTPSYVNFGYDITANQKLYIATKKNLEVFEFYLSYEITDSSFFYIDIINTSRKTINIYHITYDASNQPIQTLKYSNTDVTIELLVEVTGVTPTGNSPPS